MVYNEQGDGVFNFGKHKGKKIEDVFNAEPSYYSWMMQGDFPLYTKRKLEEIYSQWNAKKVAERQPKPVQPKPVETLVIPAESKKVEEPVKPTAPKPFVNQPKKEFHKPDNRNHQQNNNQNRPQRRTMAP